MVDFPYNFCVIFFPVADIKTEVGMVAATFCEPTPLY